MNPTRKRSLTHVSFVILGGLLLGFYGFRNRFPFVYPDTGTYLISGIRSFVPNDRPLLYGLFLRHASLEETLWLPILLQGMMLSYLLYLYFLHFVHSAYKQALFLGFITLITLGTGASVHTSMLLPDVFASISILALGLLLFVRQLGTGNFIAVSVLLFLGVGVHNSHSIILTLLVLGFTLVYAIKPWRRKMAFTGAKRIGYVWLLLIVTQLSMASLHYAYGGGFRVTQGGHLFLLARANDMGLLKPFLDRTCEQKNYTLCTYKDSLPGDLLWDPNSPIVKMGATEATRPEFQRIVQGMMADGYTRNKFIIKTVESTFLQLVTFDAGDFGPQGEHSPVLWPITERYPHHYRAFHGSLQNRQAISFGFLNEVQKILLLVSFVLLILMLRGDVSIEFKFFILFLLAALFINAAVSTISGVYDRFQGRVAWLLLLPVFLYLGNHPAVNRFCQKWGSLSSTDNR